MKVLLIYPRAEYRKIPIPHWTPLGLSFLAAALKKNGHTVSIFDRVATQAKIGICKEALDAAMIEHLERFRPDLIGLNTISPLIYDTAECVERIRRVYSGPVIAGGHHATALPELTLRKIEGLNGVIQGEGERAVQKLADGAPPDEIPGLCWKYGDGQIVGSPAEQIQDLDQLPFPDLKLLDLSFYAKSHVLTFRGRHLASLSLLSSRGCPRNCHFCSEWKTYGKGIRFHSPDYVCEWMRQVHLDHKVEGVYFLDNDFTADRERALQICDKICRAALHRRIRWAIQARADNLDRELLQWLKRSGCCLVEIGVETVAKKHLDSVEKRSSVEKSEKAIRMCKTAGIAVHAYIMTGFEGETMADLEQNLKWLKKVRPDSFSWHLIHIYPGTHLYQKKRLNFFENHEWRKETIQSYFRKDHFSAIPEKLRTEWWKKHVEPHKTRKWRFNLLRMNPPHRLLQLLKDDLDRFSRNTKTRRGRPAPK